MTLGKKRAVFTKSTHEAIGNLFKEVRPAPLLQQEKSQGSHCSTSPWKPHVYWKGCKTPQVQRTARNYLFSEKNPSNSGSKCIMGLRYCSCISKQSHKLQCNQGPWYRISSFHRCHQQILTCNQIPKILFWSVSITVSNSFVAWGSSPFSLQ